MVAANLDKLALLFGKELTYVGGSRCKLVLKTIWSVVYTFLMVLENPYVVNIEVGTPVAGEYRAIRNFAALFYALKVEGEES